MCLEEIACYFDAVLSLKEVTCAICCQTLHSVMTFSLLTHVAVEI